MANGCPCVTDADALAALCLCLFKDGVIVRMDDLCPLHSNRPGVRVLPPGAGSDE